MKEPLVSVIVPNYNHGNFLKQRIDSILSQSYKNFEIILLDDASTDDSVDIMHQYDNQASVIVVNKENSGSPFVQWLKGISLAKGKYIWLAESDDSASPDFLETCMDVLTTNENLSYCYTGSLLVDSGNNVLEDDWDKWEQRKSTKTEKFKISDGKTFICRNLFWQNYVYNASAVVFKKDNALKIDHDFTKMRYCGDWLFWIKMAQMGDVAQIFEKMNRFRQHNKRTSFEATDNGDNIKEDIAVMKYSSNFIFCSPIKKLYRTGLLLERIKHSNLTAGTKDYLYNLTKTLTGNFFLSRLVEHTLRGGLDIRLKERL